MKIKDIGPEAERRIVLKYFVLTDDDIDRLRKGDARDARFHIEHEYNMHVAWAARRREFMMTEVFPGEDPVLRHASNGKVKNVLDHDPPEKILKGDRYG